MSSHTAGLVAVAALALSPLTARAHTPSEAPGRSEAGKPDSPLPSVIVAKVSFSSREDLNRLAERLDLSAAVDNERNTVEAILTPE